MQMIKIGNRIINPEFVVDIESRPDGSVAVVLGVTEAGPGIGTSCARTILFDGDEAAAFFKHFTKRSPDIMDPNSGAITFH